MTPDEIADRLRTLRDAGAVLRRRSREDLLEALGAVFDGWRDAGSAWRRGLESELPAATGFSSKMVREGLNRGFRDWGSGALRALAEAELGEQLGDYGSARSTAWGFDTTAVVLGGSIPMPTFVSMIAPLLLRSPVLAKAASRDSISPHWVARSVAEVDADLGHCIEVVSFPGNDERCTRALLEAGCICATGSDATIASLAAQIRPPRRAVLDGHRLSVAVIGPEHQSDVARELALDVAMWDQLGCLSPVMVFAVGGDAAFVDRLADSLAEALADAEKRWPRGEIDAGAARDVLRERSEAELRAAAGRPVRVLTSDSTAWTVVREDDRDLRPAPLHRFVRVVPVADSVSLHEALAPLGPHLAAVALAGFGDATDAVARSCARIGASRICAPGQLQSPPLDWRRAGRSVLASLARFSSLDAER